MTEDAQDRDEWRRSTHVADLSPEAYTLFSLKERERSFNNGYTH